MYYCYVIMFYKITLIMLMLTSNTVSWGSSGNVIFPSSNNKKEHLKIIKIIFVI